MPIFLLHFACATTRATSEAERWTADACVIADNVALAEQQARELIASHAYRANELIAFSEVGEGKLASLAQMEATLYLKAEQSRTHRAVVFSQWPV